MTRPRWTWAAPPGTDLRQLQPDLLAGRADAPRPLCESMAAWHGAAFPDATGTVAAATTTWEGRRQSAALVCRDDRVVLAIAPDVRTARTTAAG